MPIPFIQEFQPFGEDLNHLGTGLGVETEQVQRAAKAQIMNNIEYIREELQAQWNLKDKNFYEFISGSYKEIKIPIVEKKNFFTGMFSDVSQLLAGLELWPRVEIYCVDAKPYQYQQNILETFTIPLKIRCLCEVGPVNEEELHKRTGRELMQELDSKLQRLTQNVHMCIRKDPTLGFSTMGEIEKPPVISQGTPWSRKENKEDVGDFYIFQGKQIEYQIQKSSY
jgi:hypothetical protein